ncbi:MAG: hypothetical protein FWE45_02960 [Firmicutes bacterium]|nr:hypothetical protein [Bacillota bacterium]
MIIAVAMKAHNGKIYVGNNRHSQIEREYGLGDGGKRGYLTDKGEFLDRFEALDYVIKHGQKTSKPIEIYKTQEEMRALPSESFVDSPDIDIARAQQIADAYNALIPDRQITFARQSEFAQRRELLNAIDMDR